MKKLMTIAGCIAVIIFISWQADVTFKKSYADVEQIEGYYIFVNSKPLHEYTYLGSVKFSNTLGLSEGQFIDVRNKLIKRAKKDFPKADALMFQFSNGSADKCDAIMFKD